MPPMMYSNMMEDFFIIYPFDYYIYILYFCQIFLFYLFVAFHEERSLMSSNIHGLT